MQTSTEFSESYNARRERLGLGASKPNMIIKRGVHPKRARDIINVTHEVIDDRKIPTAPSSPGMEVPSALMWRQIIREVCEKHGITYIELCSKRRARTLVMARHEACYRLRNETTMSYPQIGQRIGGRDHTTALSSIKRYERMLAGEVYRDTRVGLKDVSTANKENGND